jgi:hypothetical protein
MNFFSSLVEMGVILNFSGFINILVGYNVLIIDYAVLKLLRTPPRFTCILMALRVSLQLA